MSIVNTLVEGDLDEAAAVKILAATHHVPGDATGSMGGDT